MATETAWLIELSNGGPPMYWCRLDDEHGVCGWSRDRIKAIQFCRAQDAQTIIDDNGWTTPKPVEHWYPDIPRHRFDTPKLGLR
jgi:hypothetical protein